MTTIGHYAFSECTGLTNVTLGNNVTTIGGYAFSECTGLTNVTLGNNVTTIGNKAFSKCSGLTNIEIPNSVTTIGDYAFSECTGLTNVKIGSGVSSITTKTFSGCKNIEKIEINCSTFDNWFADAKTSIKEVILGDNVTRIKAFSSYSGLTSIVVAEGNTKYDSREECNAIIETESNTLIVGCKNTTIPNGVKIIGEFAFTSCIELTNIEIPNSVTTIGRAAFNGCSGLTSIKIPNSVTTIRRDAFNKCTGLTSIEIPNSVTTIESSAFYGCTSLTNITSLIPAEKLFAPGIRAFNRCNNSNCILYVPAGAKETYAATEGWNEFTNIVELEDTNIDKVVSPDNSLYFDLNGRGVENPTRGIYIVNGKKNLVK